METWGCFPLFVHSTPVDQLTFIFLLTAQQWEFGGAIAWALSQQSATHSHTSKTLADCVALTVESWLGLDLSNCGGQSYRMTIQGTCQGNACGYRPIWNRGKMYILYTVCIVHKLDLKGCFTCHFIVSTQAYVNTQDSFVVARFNT